MNIIPTLTIIITSIIIIYVNKGLERYTKIKGYDTISLNPKDWGGGNIELYIQIQSSNYKTPKWLIHSRNLNISDTVSGKKWDCVTNEGKQIAINSRWGFLTPDKTGKITFTTLNIQDSEFDIIQSISNKVKLKHPTKGYICFKNDILFCSNVNEKDIATFEFFKM